MPGFTHSTGHHLPVGDAQLYYELAGNPSGTPLVLLHGGLGSMADFNAILGRLPDEFQWVGIDFRGHGRSTLGSIPLTFQQHQEDVERVLDHLGIPSCAVLGFSDGGIVGYRLAAGNPERIQALVTVGASMRLEPDSPVFGMLSGLTAEMWVEMFPDSVSRYEAVNPKPNLGALVEALVALWTDLTATGYPDAMVGKITAPSLIVRGDADPMFSLQEAMEVRDALEGAHFFNVPFASHEVHKDSPDLFLAAVNEFLREPRKLQNGE